MRNLVLTIAIFLQTSLMANDDLQSLLTLIAADQSNKVKFVETRSASFLSKPTRLSGTMVLTKSGDMVKYIDAPYQSQQRISGDLLIIQKNGVEESVILLDDYPELTLGINSIRWTLLGDLEKLNKDFTIDYKFGDSDWVIRLTPKSNRALSDIASISMTGYQGNIFYIKIFQSNGDSVLTTFNEQHQSF